MNVLVSRQGPTCLFECTRGYSHHISAHQKRLNACSDWLCDWAIFFNILLKNYKDSLHVLNGFIPCSGSLTELDISIWMFLGSFSCRLSPWKHAKCYAVRAKQAPLEWDIRLGCQVANPVRGFAWLLLWNSGNMFWHSGGKIYIKPYIRFICVYLHYNADINVEITLCC